MMQKGEAVMATDEYGEDPWAMVASRDVCRKSAVSVFRSPCTCVVRLGFGPDFSGCHPAGWASRSRSRDRQLQ